MGFLIKIKQYLSLVKFSHTIFAMPFALIGFFLASEKQEFTFEPIILFWIILCMVFARNAAMGFNRYIDRKIDKKNPRTSSREIPAGTIKPLSALIFVIINSLMLIACSFFINPLCFYLSPLALLIILGYSLTKRFTWICHLILGLALSIAPVGAYIAVSGEFNLIPVLFAMVVLFWVAGFDIIYAMQDIEFDKENKLKSVPVLLGNKNALRLSVVLHFITSLFLFSTIFFMEVGVLFYIGFLVFSALLIYQHLIVKENDLSKVNLAFFTTNGFAGVMLAVFVIADFLFYFPAFIIHP